MRNRVTYILKDKPKIGSIMDVDTEYNIKGIVLKYKKILMFNDVVYETRVELYKASELREKIIDDILNF